MLVDNPMTYTQDTFIELLGRNFGEVLFEGGRYYIEGIDNKQIASNLDYDNSSFSGCMKLGNKVSFETVIKRLKTYEKLKQMEADLAEAKSLAADEKKKNSSLISQRNFAGILGLLALISLLVFVAWLPSQIQDSVESLAASASQGYVVDDEGKMDIIMEWHGQIMMNTLAWEGTVLHEKYRMDPRLARSEEARLATIEEIRAIIRRTVKKGRNRLRSLGFVTPDGRNLATVLEEASPFSSIVDGDNPLFGEGLKRGMQNMFDPRISDAQLAEIIREESFNMQVKVWNDMRNRLFR